MLKSLTLAAVIAAAALPATAAPEAFALDPSHSQVVFSYNHAGFSTTYGMYSGFSGDISFDAEDPAASTVSVTIAAESMITGFDARTQHFLKSGDFFKLDEYPDVTFTSTAIEVTGENTANITGDLTLNGVTKSVVLETTLNQMVDAYPFPPNEGKKAMGFDASVTLLRSDFNLGLFAPFVGDEVALEISVEAIAAE